MTQPSGELTDPVERGLAWLQHEKAVAEVTARLGPGAEPDLPSRPKDYAKALKRLYNKRKQLLGL